MPPFAAVSAEEDCRLVGGCNAQLTFLPNDNKTKKIFLIFLTKHFLYNN